MSVIRATDPTHESGLKAVKPTLENSKTLLRVAACGFVLLALAGRRCAQATEFSKGFDDERTSWNVHYDKSRVRTVSHRRDVQIRAAGEASESLTVEVLPPGGIVQLQHPLPPARVMDDLRLSLWVRSSRNGAVLLLRVVFPRQQDPSTGSVLTTYLQGDTYTSAGDWQQLQCRTVEKLVRERLVLLRARLNEPHIDTRDVYVDRAILTAKLEPGTTELFVDELRFGPVVSPETTVEHLSREEAAEKSAPPIEFRLDRLQVDGRPFFPRIAAYHQDGLDELKRSGLNVIWVPDYRDKKLLGSLRKVGLWATATPPRAVSESGDILGAGNASLVPFSEESAAILFWNLGTRIPAGSRRKLVSWAEQVRRADHRYRRPCMVDVSGLERMISREVPMLGVSRHALNTSFSPRRYRDWLTEKRNTARPGSFVWTWVQTEPTSDRAEARYRAHQSPIVIEPEQIRLQVYTALAAGCRGIGYWKTTSLDDDLPGALERRLAITQLNLELQLLEPWLATGTLIGQVPFEVRQRRGQQITQRSLDFRSSEPARRERDALLRAREQQLEQDKQLSSELEAAIIRSDYGMLLLPIWYQSDAQFVPGQMAANDATIVVPGADESASAWELTTTAIRNLTRQRVTGGVKITLPVFDQTAAVILSSDRTLIAKLRAKVKSLAAESSRVSVELARAKLTRVKHLDEQLEQFGVGQPDAPQLLAQAKTLVEHSETAKDRGDHHAARQLSANAMQLLRILQRAHWYDAVRTLSSPVSSPHTICFQTLPDHWRMIARIGRSPHKIDNNLLRSGDFEDIDTMLVEGWKHSQERVDGVRAAAELYPVSRKGTYSLRLVAVPETGEDSPKIIDHSPVTVSTPPVMVHSGQIVHISGWVRVVAPVVGNLDGAMMYDSLAGPSGALRWHEPIDWQRFVIVREVQQSGQLSVTISLGGMGEVQFDDLRIIPHTPRSEDRSLTGSQDPADAKSSRPRALDFLNRLPRLRPLAPRKP